MTELVLIVKGTDEDAHRAAARHGVPLVATERVPEALSLTRVRVSPRYLPEARDWHAARFWRGGLQGWSPGSVLSLRAPGAGRVLCP